MTQSVFTLIILLAVPLVIAVTVYGMNRKNPRLRRRNLFLRIGALVVFVAGLGTIIIGTFFCQENLYAELNPLGDSELLLPERQLTPDEVAFKEGEINALVTFVVVDKIGVPVAVKQLHIGPRERKDLFEWEKPLLGETQRVTIVLLYPDIREFDGGKKLRWWGTIDVLRNRSESMYGQSGALDPDNPLDIARTVWLNDFETNSPARWYAVVQVRNPVRQMIWAIYSYVSEEDLHPVTASEWLSSLRHKSFEVPTVSSASNAPSEREAQKKPVLQVLLNSVKPITRLLLLAVVLIGGLVARRYVVGVTFILLFTIAVLVSLDSYLLDDNLARITGDGNILQRTQAVRQCDTTFFFKDTAHRRLKEIADRKDLSREVCKEINFVRGNSDGVKEGE